MFKCIRFKIASILLDKAINEALKGTLDGAWKAYQYFKWVCFIIPKNKSVEASLNKADNTFKRVNL